MPGQPPAPAVPAGPMGAGLIGMPGYVSPEWTMPGEPPADAPLVSIDRETIDLVGGRPTVSLHTLGLSNRTVLSNYLTQLVNAKLMRRSTAMDAIPEITDPLAEWQGIIAEDAMVDPDMLRLIQYPRALAQQGDVEGWLTYWATILLPQIVGALQGMQAPPQPPPPPGGGGQAPIPQPQARGAVQGANPAAEGRGPGSEGAPVGRPY